MEHTETKSIESPKALNTIEMVAGTALTQDELREKVLELEKVMFQMTEHHIKIEPRHIFTQGIYAREITIPEGSTVVGEKHKTTHINILSKGKISVLTERGIETLEAPYTFVAPPGTKRVGFAHTEVVWTTFHATEETNIAKLEQQLIEKTYTPPIAVEEVKVLEEKK